jgi:hypothetical protein
MKDAEGWRLWIILVSGSLTGPILVGLWFLLLQMGGASPRMLWQGGPFTGWAGSGISGMFFAFIIGLLTSSLYLVVLKALYHRSVGVHSESAQI